MKLIDDYLEHLRQSSATDATITKRGQMLRRLHADLPHGLGQVTEDELRAWLYRNGWSRNTRATYYNTLRSFYGRASDPADPWISFNPTADLPPVRGVRGVARPCTDEQLAHILTEAADPYRLWSVLAAYQGLRCIEISRLDREHVTEERLTVVRGKGGRPRVHDTDPYVWAAVQDLPRGPVAVMRGQRATPAQISCNTAHYFRDRLGLPGVALHRLRHWLGVTTQRAYKDPRVTQAVLGHASLSSTQIYTDATAEQQRVARAMLPRLAG